MCLKYVPHIFHKSQSDEADGEMFINKIFNLSSVYVSKDIIKHELKGSN